MRLAAALALTVLIAGCGKPAGGDETPAAPAPTAKAPTEAEAQAMLASLPAPYNTADLANGRTQFARCKACHTVGEGQANQVGPNLYGVFNRPMATVAGYNYSDALKNSGEHGWDGGHMDAWIEDPRGSHPGTKMAFAGIKDAEDRKDLIAWLMIQTGYKPDAAHAEGADHH